MRHRRIAPRSLGSLLLSSLLALLALSCFPVLAQAEGSSGVQYNPGLPNAEGHHSPEHEPIAKSSTQGGGGTSTTPPQGGSPSPAPTHVSSGGVPSEEGNGAGATNRPDRSQGSPGQGQSNGARSNAQSPAPVATSATSEGGSSSPLVPILIAIGALAAVSLGAVLVRQRRQRSGGGGLSTRAG